MYSNARLSKPSTTHRRHPRPATSSRDDFQVGTLRPSYSTFAPNSPLPRHQLASQRLAHSSMKAASLPHTPELFQLNPALVPFSSLRQSHHPPASESSATPYTPTPHEHRNQPQAGKESVGGLLALDGRMGELEKVTKTIPEGEYLAGDDLWVRWGPSGYGHGITCVGYDDQVGFDVNGDGKISNDIDGNGDGQVTLADWERGAFIVVNSWGHDWSKDGKIFLLYSAMVDPTWERGNYLGRIEVGRYLPQSTLKLKLACNNRSALRVTIGIARDTEAAKPEHEITPQFLNGWPLFGQGNNVGAVPLAGPGDDSPLEVGIDLTPLLQKLGPDADGKGRLFLRVARSEESEATGTLHSLAVRSYDDKGDFHRETTLDVKDGAFGSTPFILETVLP